MQIHRKTILAAAMAAAFFASSAFAQTATKAPSLALTGYPTRCGLYYGANAEGGASNVNGAPPGTVQVGGDIGLLVGYACVLPGVNIPYFVEGIFDFQNLNASANGFAMTGPAHLEQRVGVQTPLMQFLPALGFPSTGTIPNLPVLPPGVTVTGAAQNYLYGSVSEDDISATLGLSSARAWMVTAGFGTGLLTPIRLSNGWAAVIDTWAGITFQSTELCIGGMCPALGTGFKTGVSVKF